MIPQDLIYNDPGGRVLQSYSRESAKAHIDWINKQTDQLISELDPVAGHSLFWKAVTTSNNGQAMNPQWSNSYYKVKLTDGSFRSNKGYRSQAFSTSKSGLDSPIDINYQNNIEGGILPYLLEMRTLSDQVTRGSASTVADNNPSFYALILGLLQGDGAFTKDTDIDNVNTMINNAWLSRPLRTPQRPFTAAADSIDIKHPDIFLESIRNLFVKEGSSTPVWIDDPKSWRDWLDGRQIQSKIRMLEDLRLDTGVNTIFGGISMEAALFNNIDPVVGLQVADLKQNIEGEGLWNIVTNVMGIEGNIGMYVRPYAPDAIPDILLHDPKCFINCHPDLLDGVPNGMRLTIDNVDGDLEIVLRDLFPKITAAEWDQLRIKFAQQHIDFTIGNFWKYMPMRKFFEKSNYPTQVILLGDAKIDGSVKSMLKSYGFDFSDNYLDQFDNLGQFLAWHIIPHEKMLHFLLKSDFQSAYKFIGYSSWASISSPRIPTVYIPLEGSRGKMVDFITYLQNWGFNSQRFKFNSWLSPESTKQLIEFRNLLIGNLKQAPITYQVGWFSLRLFVFSQYWQWKHVADVWRWMKSTKFFKLLDRA